MTQKPEFLLGATFTYEGQTISVTRILDSSCYKVFKIVLDILIVLQSLSGQVEQFDDFLLSPPSPPHIGLPLTHSASRNVTILNCIQDYILMSSAFEISPTPSKSHQRAVTDKIQCLLGTKLFTICKMNSSTRIASAGLFSFLWANSNSQVWDRTTIIPI